MEAISRIQSAASSPSASLELYLQALDAVKYSDRHQEFLEWKQKNQEMLRNPSEQNAAQLQLRYLLLGLQRSGNRDAVSQVPETLSYLNALVELHFLEKPPRTTPPKKGISPSLSRLKSRGVWKAGRGLVLRPAHPAKGENNL